MSTDSSRIEFRQYVAEQITDYLTHHTTGFVVTPNKMKILEKGVHAICVAAYPEHENIFSKQVPRLIRTALDMNQLDFNNKVQRIIDTARPKDEIMSGILGEITATKTSQKTLWTQRVKSEKQVGMER